MTLKEEEINRKEMAKILPNIQIGYIDKDVKEYLNNTIDDIIEEETKETILIDNIDDNQDEKIDIDTENKFKDDIEVLAKEIKSSPKNSTNLAEIKGVVTEEDIPASAAEDLNNFLNNLIDHVDKVNSNMKF